MSHTYTANNTIVNGGGAVGGAGTNTTISGAGNYTTTAHWADTTSVISINRGGNTVQIEPGATLEVKGNVKINGVDLEERLNVIETLLQIPTRDVTMEATHPKLAQLYKEYMEELEKYKTWHRLLGD